MSTDALRYSAFTYEGRGGNPAGVVLDAHGLDDAAMLSIAADLGYSETAFLFPRIPAPTGTTGTQTSHDDPETFTADLRFFSPVAEVAFCGHATVATAAALAKKIGARPLMLHTPAGPVGVDTWKTDSGTGATLTSPPASSATTAEPDLARALEAFGWTRDDLDPRFPPHVAFAGNQHLMLAVKSRSTLAEMEYEFNELESLMAARSWTTVNVFWAESDDVFHARNPFPPGGVVEDPATGAAAAAFGGYLRELGLADGTKKIRILQGHDMGAPSELHIEIVADQPGIRVSGQASPVPAGESAP